MSEPLRVAHIIGRMCISGVENVSFNYYRAMDHSKVQFDFFYDEDSTINPPADIVSEGAGFYQVPRKEEPLKFEKALRKYFEQNHYQIVHANLNTMNYFSLKAAYQAGVPVRISHNHSVAAGNETAKNILKNVLKKSASRYATDLFAVSEKAAVWMYGQKAYDEGKVKLIKNAVDLDLFSHPDIEKVSRNKALYHLDHKTVIGHVGRFTPAKNHTGMLEIFKRIHEINNNSVLLLIGDGELRSTIEDKIHELKLEDSVILAGAQSDPQNWYPLMNVMILPSVFEGLPLTVIEAQAAGVPVVVSDVVPEEACISDGWKRLSLSLGKDIWAEEVMKMAHMHALLNESSHAFDIHYAAPKLMEWYLERAEEVSKKG